MSYAVAQDLIDHSSAIELAQLTDKVNGLVIDSALVDKALADVDAEIDGYLAGKYDLPLPIVPDLLKRIACDLARYRLHADGAPPHVRQAFEDRRRDLEALASGKRSLGLPATVAVTGSAAPSFVAGASALEWSGY